MFNANQLKRGDFVLVKTEDEPRGEAAKVIYAKAYASIGVRFANHKEKWFGSRDGFGDIVAGARRIEGQWMAL
jgi:hypothetical protein